ncbi:flagellar biosynthetic protein FliO [Shewanella donghaensis]|uniref:flagellar biosynthetic protein FliO n=1 Tax=Shewanella donghaensis TaxID=238836 RepID=UPI001D0407D5|nr:flagellar biosynthetic protein FliO [Shewanella donghaensis]
MLNVISSLVLSSNTVNETASVVVVDKAPEASNIAALSSMMGGLIVVIVIIFVLAYIVKKLNLVQSNQGVIKTIAVTSLGQKEKLVVVELEGQQYLLGVTSQQINLIEKLDSSVEIETNTFASRLKQAKAQTAEKAKE